MKVSQSFTKFHKLCLSIIVLSVLFISSCNKESQIIPKESPETESRGICPTTNPGLGCIVKSFPLPTTIFYYEGCPILTGFLAYYCPSGITIEQLTWTMTSGNAACNMLKKKLSDLYISGGSGAAQAEWNNIVKSLNNQAENLAFAQVPSSISYACTQTNPCSSNNFSLKTISASCIKLCATKEVDEEGTPIWTLRSIVCGESCCYKYTPFCILPNGSICRGTPQIFQVSPCTSTTIVETCDNNSICSPSCDRL